MKWTKIKERIINNLLPQALRSVVQRLDSGDAEREELAGVVADLDARVTALEKAPPDPVDPLPEGADDVDASSITYLHADVSEWPIVAEIGEVEIADAQICIDYGSPNWPAVTIGSSELIGNPWIGAFIDGVWYAATFEWLRPGQTCKALNVPADEVDIAHAIGPHTKRSPLLEWVPQSGEDVLIFVSTLARGSERNGNQRTAIRKVVWP